MHLQAGCPRCRSGVRQEEDDWRCENHGRVMPLWRPQHPGYDALAEHLLRCRTVPTLLPWPMSPGWMVSDFGCVADVAGTARASVVSCAGVSDADGVVEVTVVTEEAGVGLGARCAGMAHTDPGHELGEGPPHVKVRVDGRPASLWALSTSTSDLDFDRSVFAGEAQGRWLWLVLRPASAALLLHDDWVLSDIAGLGPELIELQFGGAVPSW